MKIQPRLMASILFFSTILASSGFAGELSVAVAANFSNPMKEIAAQFEKAKGHHLTISSGPTGKFYAQIKNGAPFEVFLSADVERPKLLEDEGLTVKGTRFIYAIGQLVLWSARSDLVDS